MQNTIALNLTTSQVESILSESPIFRKIIAEKLVFCDFEVPIKVTESKLISIEDKTFKQLDDIFDKAASYPSEEEIEKFLTITRAMGQDELIDYLYHTYFAKLTKKQLESNDYFHKLYYATNLVIQFGIAHALKALHNWDDAKDFVRENITPLIKAK